MVGPEALFRRRLRQLIRRRYRSVDRFYLESGISKGHLSEILRGRGSPSVATLVKIAKALEIELTDFFVFPERSSRDRALECVRAASPETVQRVLRLFHEPQRERRKGTA